MTNRTKTYFKTRLLLLAIFFVFASTIYGQSSGENLKSQAQQMANYFKTENFEPYVKFVYPEVLKMAGGSANMIKLIEQQLSGMKNAQMAIKDVMMGKPTAIISHNNQLQSTIPQSLVITTPDSKITSKYNLIAISTDSGKNWSFIDTSGKDIQTMRRTFPQLSPELLLPAKEVSQN